MYLDCIKRDDIVEWLAYSNDNFDVADNIWKIVQSRAWKIAKYVIYNGNHRNIKHLLEQAIWDSVKATRAILQMLFEAIPIEKRMSYVGHWEIDVAICYSEDTLKCIFEVSKKNDHYLADQITTYTVGLASRISFDALKYLFEILKNERPHESKTHLQENAYSQENEYSLVDYVDKGTICEAAEYSLDALKYLFKILRENEYSLVDYIDKYTILAAARNSLDALKYVFGVIIANDKDPKDYINFRIRRFVRNKPEIKRYIHEMEKLNQNS